MNVKDLPLKEQDLQLKVKALPQSRLLIGIPSEAERKELIGAANAAFVVGNSWDFARRVRN